MTKPAMKCSVCGAKIFTTMIRQCSRCVRGRGGL